VPPSAPFVQPQSDSSDTLPVPVTIVGNEDFHHLPIARFIVDLLEYSKGKHMCELVDADGSPKLRSELNIGECAPGFRDAVFWFFRSVVLLTFTTCPAIQPASGWTIHSNAGGLAFIALFDSDAARSSRLDFFTDNTDRLIYLYGVAFAVRYLHSFEIFGANLAPANIEVDAQHRPRIAICPFSSLISLKANPDADLVAYRKLFACVASQELSPFQSVKQILE
jgi:hypothetical protein